MFFNLLENKLSKYIVVIFLILFSIKSVINIIKTRQALPVTFYSYKEELYNQTSDATARVAQTINDFYEEADIRNISLPINNVDFTIQKQENLAVCYWNPNLPFETPVAKISIDPQIINNNESLKTTIFHELGHCILGLDHNNQIINTATQDTIPISIMHSSDVNDAWVYSHMNQYVDKLFMDYIKSKRKAPMSIYEDTFNKIVDKTITPFKQAKSFINYQKEKESIIDKPSWFIAFQLFGSIFFIINIFIVLYQITEIPLIIFSKLRTL